jgi:hypothetical protein
MTLVDALWIVPFVALVVYIRIRQKFRKRRLRPLRMLAILGIFTVLACRMAYLIVGNPAYLPGLVAGLPLGVLLGLTSAIRTKLERDSRGTWLTPERYTMSAVLLIVTVWLIYRLTHWQAFAQHGLEAVPAPWGLVVPGMLLGFVCTNISVTLGRARSVAYHPTVDGPADCAPEPVESLPGPG